MGQRVVRIASRRSLFVYLVLTSEADDMVMITMTAIVRPVESIRSFPQVGQNLRRHFEHTLLFTDQMFVIFPGIGAVLVTEHSTTYRFDIVGTIKRLRITAP